MSEELVERRFHHDRPWFRYNIFDNGEILQEDPMLFSVYMEPYRSDPIRYIVTKYGTECIWNDGKPPRIKYSFYRIAEQAKEATERGTGVFVVFSALCTIGRKERRKREGESTVIGKELEDRRLDGMAGKKVVKDYISEACYRAGLEHRHHIMYVTPEDFADDRTRKRIFERCLDLIKDGVVVWMNEDDAVRRKLKYNERITFDDNDGLSSLAAQTLHEIRPDCTTALSYHMDQMGILPASVVRRYDEAITERRRAMERLHRCEDGRDEPEELSILSQGGRGFKDMSDIIAIVKRPNGLEKQIVTGGETLTDRQRNTRGGLQSKIKWASRAADNDVPTWVGSGMFSMHDSHHRTGKRDEIRFNPVLAILDGDFTCTHFLPKQHPLYPKPHPLYPDY